MNGLQFLMFEILDTLVLVSLGVKKILEDLRVLILRVLTFQREPSRFSFVSRIIVFTNLFCYKYVI